ncbi:GliK protein [Aspergillus sclerotiicarbonarius CBS 121057]|uniref:gamma-glutamylcyclotransferase n=1 Tax=Aspergillus sclerotiicarbonarius (strain CBS 121057 / IBT 28362) TaxID=1448318 RepID=A0A319E333_ASPSB|nr:GliK protein [Aspergillus sclerotiicarbonarius CBS 121057]
MDIGQPAAGVPVPRQPRLRLRQGEATGISAMAFRHGTDEEGHRAPRTRRSSMIETYERLGELSPLAGNTHPSPQETSQSLPETTTERQRVSTTDRSLDKDADLADKVTAHHFEKTGDGNPPSEETVLYLAYGSNLCSETFLGTRGIKPLSQINVVVPSLWLTFDLPGIPYMEPCFAATRLRKAPSVEEGSNRIESNESDEKTALETSHLIQKTPDYTPNMPLIGVVYEVTLTDYARIIATEGGGRGYEDKVVDCYPFPKSYNPADPLPERPSTKPFKAHTLLSPAVAEDFLETTGQAPTTPRKRTFVSRFSPLVRPNPFYAQPSARYLNLITTGAAEHDFPITYRNYLAGIQPYRITTLRQKIGKAVFVGCWGPPVFIVLLLQRMCAGSDGRSPAWLVRFADAVFFTFWQSYDNVFRGLFGDGERTIGDNTRR